MRIAKIKRNKQHYYLLKHIFESLKLKTISIIAKNCQKKLYNGILFHQI